MTLSPLSAEELQAIDRRRRRALDGEWGAHAVDLIQDDIPRLLETVAYWQEESEQMRLFARMHHCEGNADQHRLCFPCVEYMGTARERTGMISTTDAWDDPKYHTAFCIAYRAPSERAQGET